ncbi:MAG: hypothetical protein K2X93_17870 [Candidatus Obscuribacterales bacterium]|nr:hypothetical protein [Candidatus Obscuribacterales bacterium]
MKKLKSKKRVKNRLRAARRASAGMYLVEALVSLVLSGILAFGLLEMFTTSLRAMGRSGNEAAVNEIMDELSEFTRSYGYSRLSPYRGQTQSLFLNKTLATVPESPQFHNRPLVLDMVAKQWQEKTATNAFGSIDGKVTYAIAEGLTPDILNVTITVSWSDSYSQTVRQVRRSLVVMEIQ